MRATTSSWRTALSATLLAVVAAVTCGGCASRFSAKTDYLAPGFNRESLRGKAVAVVPAGPAANPAAYADELAGILEGMHEAGAQVRVVQQPVPDPVVTDGTQFAPEPPGDVHSALDSPGSTRPRLMALAIPPRRLGREPGAAYALVVRFTETVVYRAYATPHDRGGAGRAAAAERTTGRRVGVQLELVRLSDGEPQWAAHGTGEAWRSLTAAAPGAMPAAANVDDDIGGGNLNLYPDPPSAQSLSRRLVRRLLAHVPFPIEVQPS
jgi:hypothetical protein